MSLVHGLCLAFQVIRRLHCLSESDQFSSPRSVFKPFIFGDRVSRLTGITKSPEGPELSPHQRKHQLWLAVESSQVGF